MVGHSRSEFYSINLQKKNLKKQTKALLCQSNYV